MLNHVRAGRFIALVFFRKRPRHHRKVPSFPPPPPPAITFCPAGPARRSFGSQYSRRRWDRQDEHPGLSALGALHPGRKYDVL